MKRLCPFLILFALFILSGSCATKSSLPAEEDIFIIDMDSPYITLGEIDFQLVRGLGNARRLDVTVLYYPVEDAVALRFDVDTFTYHQFWSARGRQAFIDALVQYNRDFDERSLVDSQRRTRQIYGVTNGFLAWQQFRHTIQAGANMDVELGYAFHERRPYFSVTQGRAEFIHDRVESLNRTSMMRVFYFTREQAASLATIFDRQFLRDSMRPPVLPDYLPPTLSPTLSPPAPQSMLSEYSH